MLLAQIIVNGVLLGGLYACMALSFSLVWGVLNIINLAHGSMILLGAYVTYVLHVSTGIDPVLTVPASALALFLFGYCLQSVVFNRTALASIYMTLILTFGLDMMLINFNIAVFSSDIRSITTWYTGQALDIGGVRIAYARILVFACALAMMLALYLFLKFTAGGRAIRAIAQNPKLAKIIGIDAAKTYSLTFGIGAAMAGVTGSLMTVVYAFSPVIGDMFTLKSFVVVVLGGLGNIPSTILAGVFLGVAENLVSGYLDAGYRDAVSFCLLIAVLTMRPNGFLGRSSYAVTRA